MRYEFIRANQGGFDIKLLCKEMEVSRSGYYAWFNRPASARTKENRHLIEAIRQDFGESQDVWLSSYTSKFKSARALLWQTSCGSIDETSQSATENAKKI